ncbi:MAG: SdrD B-like domain-containing protein [Acidobacteriota bacterium]
MVDNGVNDVPTAKNDTCGTDREIAITVDVLDNDFDVDGDALAITAATDGSHGTVSMNGVSTVTYTPDPGFVGTDEFTYTIADPMGETATATVLVSVRDMGNRVQGGLLALYGFDEGQGGVVRDISGVGAPLDLNIGDTNRVTWLPEGGLRVDSSTLISSPNAATKLTSAIMATEAITVEAWVAPTHTNQGGPARIVTLSKDTGNRNVTLGADGTRYVNRLRTTTMGNNGMPSLDAPWGSLTTSLTHVVYTRSASGLANLYVDGVPVSTGSKDGNLSNWNGSYRFGLGNELNNSRTWLGTYKLVAMYDRALDGNEVWQNYVAGGGTGTQPEPPPTGVESDLCVNRAVSDPVLKGNGSSHAVWLPQIATDFVFQPDGRFVENLDGTGSLTGTIVSLGNPNLRFQVDAQVSGFQVTPPNGSPKRELRSSAYVDNGGPIDPSTWYYYTNLSGTLTGLGDLDGAILSITRRGPAWQVGNGANGKNGNYGASSWFDYTVVQQPNSGHLSNSHGDFNLDLFDCPAPPVALDCVDFDLNFETDAQGNALATGQIIDTEFAAAGIRVTTHDPVNKPAMIFDSAAPTGGDSDLGTPNQDFGGPGVGSGGAAGAAGENAVPEGKVLIISEDRDSSDPDDNANGGTLIFTFDGPAFVETVGLHDVDNNPATVRAFDASGNLILQRSAPGVGNNGIQTVEVNAGGVRRLEVHFPDSGAVTHIDFASCDVEPELANIIGNVWDDANNNGVRDAGEPGLADVAVTIAGGATNLVRITDANGDYASGDVPAGSYTVTVDASTLPAGYVQTFDTDGLATPDAVALTVPAGTTGEADFGYRAEPANIVGVIWNDLNADGVQDAGEPVLPEIVVTIAGGGGVSLTRTTGADGRYDSGEVPPGTYTVTVDVSTLPADFVQTFDTDGLATPDTVAVAVAAGETGIADFAYRELPADIVGLIWNDENGDGFRDAGEPALPNVTVTIAGGGVSLTRTTGADGSYASGEVPAGTYTVTVDVSTLPADFVQTFDTDGLATPDTVTLTVPAGDTGVADFAYREQLANVVGVVWDDANNNGVFDAGESALPNVTVTISGTGVALTRTTAADGSYASGDVPAGIYAVVVDTATLPAGYGPTFDSDGLGTPNTVTVAAPAGGTGVADFGYRLLPSRVVGTVWDDQNENGTLDAGEPGYANVPVLVSDGASINLVLTTGADGSYDSGELPPGSYAVFVDTSALPPGVTPTFDADGVATPNTANVTAPAGGQAVADFGYAPAPVATDLQVVIDKVWVDGTGAQIPTPADVASFVITAESSAGIAQCFYTAPTEPLACQYFDLATFDPIASLPVPAGTSYVVTEQGVPAGFTTIEGSGTFTGTEGCTPGGAGDPDTCLHPVVNSESGGVSCTPSIYGVTRDGAGDDQLFNIDLGTSAFRAVGSPLDGFDIRALDLALTIDGQKLFAVANAGPIPGAVYEVDLVTGALNALAVVPGVSSAAPVTAMAINSFGDIWVFQPSTGLYLVDLPSASALLFAPAPAAFESLSWDSSNSLLYGSIGSQLFIWDVAGSGTVQTLCTNLPPSTLGLDLQDNGSLLGSALSPADNLFSVNPLTCTVTPKVRDVPLPQIEAISIESCTGAPIG